MGESRAMTEPVIVAASSPGKPPPKIPRKRRWRWYLGGGLLAVALLLVGCWRLMIWMPGQSYRGELPPLGDETVELEAQLRADVKHLAVNIGERNLDRYPQLEAARTWMRDSLT